MLGNPSGGNNNHHHHRENGGGSNANHANPSVVRYAIPRKSGVLGRYHRTVGGLSSSSHRRAAARRHQQQQELRARTAAGRDAAKVDRPEAVGEEVVRHAQIHPRPTPTQAQATGNANDNANPQQANLVANLRHATLITTDRPPYTNVPQPPPTSLESTLPKSSSSAAIPSHHIKRTASELQLCEDEMRAEYRDRVMYVRCYPAIAGATTARRMTMLATSTATVAQIASASKQQYLQGPYNQEPTQEGVPTTANLVHATNQEAGRHIDAYRRSTAPPVLSHDSGEADWLLYDDHPPDGSSPSSTGGANEAPLASMPDRSANPRPSYADEVESSSSTSSPIVGQNPTPPKDVVEAAATGAATVTEEGGAGGWPVACSQTRRNISILRQASETMYSTTTATNMTHTATTSAATTGTTTTPSSSNPASRATSRTTSREEGDFNPYYQDDHADHGQMILDGDGYLEGELHDYEHPGPMPPRYAGGRATGRKNSASSYEDVFVIDDL